AVAMAAALWLLPAPHGWWVAGAVLAATLALLGWGVFAVNSSLWAPTRWRGPGQAVALTFDDGPDPAFTPRVLDILRDKQTPAAFFVVGSRVSAQPQLASRIAREGHLLGNHSHNHGLGINFSLHRRLRDELSGCNRALQLAAGVTPAFYRPPPGFKNPALGDVLRELGMVAVGWQVRAFDAVRQDAEAIIRRVLQGVRPGGVILLHDGAGLQGSAGRDATLAALPAIIDGLRAKGLRIVRLDELLGTTGLRAAGESA
ncbi:MAG: polysaccharide deacetylase family protein, partial [Planctomycetes bacterium]|nr:polysaccharide deacetylase family protein [Planctomycetota bacterium]